MDTTTYISSYQLSRDFLTQLSLPISKCARKTYDGARQTYDGARNMTGRISSFSKKFK